MIIECINCYKKFEVNSNLIPINGRYIQCGSCDHKWFFKKDNKVDINNIIPSEEISSEELSQPINGLLVGSFVSYSKIHLSVLPMPDCMGLLLGI